MLSVVHENNEAVKSGENRHGLIVRGSSGSFNFFRRTSRTGTPACGFRITGDSRISGGVNGVDQLRLDSVSIATTGSPVLQ